jgi:hypothetical protein
MMPCVRRVCFSLTQYSSTKSEGSCCLLVHTADYRQRAATVAKLGDIPASKYPPPSFFCASQFNEPRLLNYPKYVKNPIGHRERERSAPFASDAGESAAHGAIRTRRPAQSWMRIGTAGSAPAGVQPTRCDPAATNGESDDGVGFAAVLVSALAAKK